MSGFGVHQGFTKAVVQALLKNLGIKEVAEVSRALAEAIERQGDQGAPEDAGKAGKRKAKAAK